MFCNIYNGRMRLRKCNDVPSIAMLFVTGSSYEHDIGRDDRERLFTWDNRNCFQINISGPFRTRFINDFLAVHIQSSLMRYLDGRMDEQSVV